MPTPNVLSGMGLEELLLYQDQPDLFGSLTSTVCQEIAGSLNPNIPGGITDLLASAETAGAAEQDRIIAAIGDSVKKFVDRIDATIQSDLDAQELARGAATQSTLIDSIVPEANEPLSPLINLVATDTFRKIIS
jgi:hypothetical protein